MHINSIYKYKLIGTNRLLFTMPRSTAIYNACQTLASCVKNMRHAHTPQ